MPCYEGAGDALVGSVGALLRRVGALYVLAAVELEFWNWTIGGAGGVLGPVFSCDSGEVRQEFDTDQAEELMFHVDKHSDSGSHPRIDNSRNEG